jgi:hypothetical protein
MEYHNQFCWKSVDGLDIKPDGIYGMLPSVAEGILEKFWVD